MNQWYYAKAGSQIGPVSLEELRNLVGSGEVKGTDLVWNQSMKDWLPASSVAEISSAPAGSPPAGLPDVNPANPYSTPGSTWVGQVPAAGGRREQIPPGSDPIGPLACIQRGFDLTKKNAGPLILGLLIFFGISFVVGIFFGMVKTIAQGVGAGAELPPAELMGDPIRAFQWGIRSQLTPLYFVEQAVMTVISSFLFAGYYRICLNVAAGRPASPGQLFGQSQKLLRMIGVTLVLSIPGWINFVCLALLDISAAGAICLVMIVVGILVWIRFGFAGMAIVDHNLGVGEALKYSFSITRNNGFRLLGLGILSSVVMFLGFVACLVGALFTVPVGLMAFAVAYRWMKYGRGVALQGRA